MDYNLIKSKRKTIAIHIKKDGIVEVRAPLRASTDEINLFVSSKKAWIDKHLAAVSTRNAIKQGFVLSYGSKILYRGTEYPIAESSGKTAYFDGEKFIMPAGLPSDVIINTVTMIYKKLARAVLSERVRYYSEITGLVPLSVKVNGAKSHWGSCSGKNRVNFSFFLIMAPDDVIDYVVVHELAHIKEHNHSEKFWAIVASVFSDFKERRKRLNTLQNRIMNERWD